MEAREERASFGRQHTKSEPVIPECTKDEKIAWSSLENFLGSQQWVMRMRFWG